MDYNIWQRLQHGIHRLLGDVAKKPKIIQVGIGRGSNVLTVEAIIKVEVLMEGREFRVASEIVPSCHLQTRYSVITNTSSPVPQRLARTMLSFQCFHHT